MLMKGQYCRIINMEGAVLPESVRPLRDRICRIQDTFLTPAGRYAVLEEAPSCPIPAAWLSVRCTRYKVGETVRATHNDPAGEYVTGFRAIVCSGNDYNMTVSSMGHLYDVPVGYFALAKPSPSTFTPGDLVSVQDVGKIYGYYYDFFMKHKFSQEVMCRYAFAYHWKQSTLLREPAIRCRVLMYDDKEKIVCIEEADAEAPRVLLIDPLGLISVKARGLLLMDENGKECYFKDFSQAEIETGLTEAEITSSIITGTKAGGGYWRRAC